MSASNNETSYPDRLRNHSDSLTKDTNSCELVVFNSRIDSSGSRVEYEVRRGQNPRVRDHVSANEQASLLLINHFVEGDVFVNARLEIRSPYMRGFLLKFIGNYPGVFVGHNVVKLCNPPHCVFHHYHDLQKEINTLPKRSVKRTHLEFLLQYTKSRLSNGFQVYQDHIAMPKAIATLDYDNLWMIFSPGSWVYRLDVDGTPVISKLERFERCACSRPTCPDHDWSLTILNIDRRATGYEWRRKSLHLARYEGFRRVNQLNIFPLSYHPNNEREWQRLIARGREFIKYGRRSYMAYDGTAYNLSKDSASSNLCTVTSRIVIDVEGYAKIAPWRRLYGEQYKLWDGQYQNIAGGVVTTDVGGEPQDEQEIVTCSHVVPGFALSTKTWHYFLVDMIKPISFSENAFDNLPLSLKHKQMLRILSCPSDDPTSAGVDRPNCMVLLHASPGSGKSHTVESLAESVKRPLLTLQPGELGTNPEIFSRRLREILDSAQRWNSIIFVNVAEWYFAATSSSEMCRGALASALLHRLSDYKGLVFMASSQAAYAEVNAKISSYISLSISCETLSSEEQRSLWQHMINIAPVDYDASLNEDDTIAKLVPYKLNAREVKKIVDVGCIFASSQQVTLSIDHLVEAIEMVTGAAIAQVEDQQDITVEASPDHYKVSHNNSKRRRKR